MQSQNEGWYSEESDNLNPHNTKNIITARKRGRQYNVDPATTQDTVEADNEQLMLAF